MPVSYQPLKSRPLRTYWKSLERCNEINLAHASKKIQECVDLGECGRRKIAIVATGSDGRKEKGSGSLVEPVIIHDSAPDKALRYVEESLRCVRLWEQTPLSLAAGVECKDLGNAKTVFSFAYGRKGLVFPQRLLDTQLLYGSVELLRKAKARMASEWLGQRWKTIRDPLADIKRHYRKSALSGQQHWKGHCVVNYDFACAQTYYFDDPASGAMVRGFKNGPLRYVQVGLVLGLARWVSCHPAHAEKIASEWPSSTFERLEFMADAKMNKPPRTVLDELAEHYLYFLKRYHDGARAASQGHPALPFDAGEVRDRIRSLDRVLQEGMFKS